MTENIRLRASSSERWINCPGSARLEHGIPDSRSPYAEEGIQAHELAATILKHFKDKKQVDMFINVCKYSAYVHGLLTAANDNSGTFFRIINYSPLNFQNTNKVVYFEDEVDFSHVMPGAHMPTGTCDAYIIDEDTKTLHVIDLKYGKGVKVNVENNTQLLLYALGLVNDNEWDYDIRYVNLHIVQPRLDNYQIQKLTIKELESWKDFFIEKSQAALAIDAPRIPNQKWCKFCKAKDICPEYQEFNKPFSADEFDILTTKQEN